MPTDDNGTAHDIGTVNHDVVNQHHGPRVHHVPDDHILDFDLDDHHLDDHVLDDNHVLDDHHLDDYHLDDHNACGAGGGG